LSSSLAERQEAEMVEAAAAGATGRVQFAHHIGQMSAQAPSQAAPGTEVQSPRTSERRSKAGSTRSRRGREIGDGVGRRLFADGAVHENTEEPEWLVEAALLVAGGGWPRGAHGRPATPACPRLPGLSLEVIQAAVADAAEVVGGGRLMTKYAEGGGGGSAAVVTTASVEEMAARVAEEDQMAQAVARAAARQAGAVRLQCFWRRCVPRRRRAVLAEQRWWQRAGALLERSMTSRGAFEAVVQWTGAIGWEEACWRTRLERRGRLSRAARARSEARWWLAEQRAATAVEAELAMEVSGEAARRMHAAERLQRDAGGGATKSTHGDAQSRQRRRRRRYGRSTSGLLRRGSGLTQWRENQRRRVRRGRRVRR
jgi:hypothetical protein